MRFIDPDDSYDESTNPSNGWRIPDEMEEMLETARLVADLLEEIPEDERERFTSNVRAMLPLKPTPDQWLQAAEEHMGLWN